MVLNSENNMANNESPNEEEPIRELLDNSPAVTYAGVIALGSLTELASFMIDNKLGLACGLGMIAIGSVGFVKNILKHNQ